MASGPPQPPLADFGEGIGEAVAVVRNNALAAGLDATVPTCPGWTVLDVVVHLGAVQRWATAIVSGMDAQEAAARSASVEAEGAAAVDVLDWLDDGLVDLLNAIVRAPDDLEAFFFLKNAPAPRRAWARRQCHEASIHAVDTMAARLGRVPTPDQTWLRPGLAVDGIDELLRGFLPRRSSRVRSQEPYTVTVATTDGAHAWRLLVGTDPVQVDYTSGAGNAEDSDAAADTDVVVRGEAVSLYLTLWNRGADATDGRAEGVELTTRTASRPEFADWMSTWRSQMSVT